MNDKPIGIFDSGLGGLTAVRALRRLMPEENIIYFGDTGRMPYGGRSRGQIREIAAQNVAFVENAGVKAILAACGTISSNARDMLEGNRIKAIGVMRPGVEELAATGCRKLGLIATATSIESGAFSRELEALRPDAEILPLACPDFVPMIESGHFAASDPLTAEVVSRTLRPLKDAGVEAMLLGCTHYGIIADAISVYLGESVRLVAAADAAARAMQRYLAENGMQAESGGGEEYFTSGRPEDFERLAPLMLGRPLKSRVRYIEPFPLKEK